MDKKIAFLFSGLCIMNSNTANAVFGFFDYLRDKGITVDLYMHFWSNENIYPKGYDGPYSVSSDFIETIPIEDTSNHQYVIDREKPKVSITSPFSEMENLPYYNSKRFEYIAYVNQTAQFYGFQKLLNEVPENHYDMIFRWRYDQVMAYETNANTIINLLNQGITAPTIVTRPQYFMKKYDNRRYVATTDRWWGIIGDFTKFKDIHQDMYSRIVNSNKWIEEIMVGYFNDTSSSVLHENIYEQLIRPYQEPLIREDYKFLSLSDQESELKKLPFGSPRHYVGDYLE